MLIEPWDTSTLDEQERTIGRDQGRRRPARAAAEFDPVDFTTQTDGESAIPETSHVFLANPTNSGTAILRRGYSFVDGSDGLGRLDAGLFFIAYQRDPATGVRPGAAEPAARRHERVHPAHVVGGLRLPARCAGRRRLVGPGPLRRLSPWRPRHAPQSPRRTRRESAADLPADRSARSPEPWSMCRRARKWTPRAGGTTGSPRAAVWRPDEPGRTARSDPPWSNQDDGAWVTATSCTS